MLPRLRRALPPDRRPAGPPDPTGSPDLPVRITRPPERRGILRGIPIGITWERTGQQGQKPIPTHSGETRSWSGIGIFEAVRLRKRGLCQNRRGKRDHRPSIRCLFFRRPDPAVDKLVDRTGSSVRQTACKPGSVHPLESGDGTTIPLGRASRRASRGQPGRRGGNAPASATPMDDAAGRPYSALLPVGFTVPPPLPGARCALAAPFHPCPGAEAPGRFAFCGTVPGELPPPAVSRHRIPVEPGLSSSDGRGHRQRSSGRLARAGNAHAAAPRQSRSASHSAATAERRASVALSPMPSTRSGRQWRWKAASSTSSGRSVR